ncbi:hypothetical protein KY284_015090 [Solanum tuberosum]|nr:hypothetical protein KY284_015090 [Solanum tuberosum]
MKRNCRISYGWYLYIPLKIEKVVVICGGLMGFGIATALILSSIQVILKEIKFDYLQKSLKSIDVCWCLGWQGESFLNCCSGNTHDDMLLAKLETVKAGSGEPGSSVFVFNMDWGLPVWSEWLVFNGVNARARKDWY